MSAAEGFRQLAAMFEAGEVPAHSFPDVPLTVIVIAQSESDVHEFAAREGLRVTVSHPADDTTYTSAEITLDGSVTLRCVHISHS